MFIDVFRSFISRAQPKYEKKKVFAHKLIRSSDLPQGSHREPRRVKIAPPYLLRRQILHIATPDQPQSGCNSYHIIFCIVFVLEGPSIHVTYMYVEYTRIYIYVYTCMYYTLPCLYVYIDICTYMHVYINIYKYIYIYIYIYVNSY